MTDHDDGIERDLIKLNFALTMMRRAFRDLAVSFGTVDANLADRALHRIEISFVTDFENLLKKQPEGIARQQMGAAFAMAVEPLREMTQEARRLVQQGGKPKH